MVLRLGAVAWLAGVAALASGCAPAVDPSAAGAALLSGSAWVLESVGGAPGSAQPTPSATTTTATEGQVTAAPTPAALGAAWLLRDRGVRPTLIFSRGRNSASGSTGCNRYFGNFSAGSSELWFDNLVTTRMMCFDTLAAQEFQYLDALAKVQGYASDGVTLTLATSDGRFLTYSPLSNPGGASAAIYNYLCDDGLSFNASFDLAARTVALAVSTGAADTLTQEVTASGASYASQQHRLRTKGTEALLDTLYDGATHHCVAPLAPPG